MEAMQGDTNTYTCRSTPGDLQEGEWRLVLSADGTWTGKIQFQAKDAEAIHTAFTKSHGAAVEIDGSSHTVEVHSDFIKDPRAEGR